VTIAEHLQTLSIYVPPPVTRLALQNPHRQLGGTWRRFHAATVFADITGFTPLAEALATSGVRGAEELTTILNQVFEALITTAESHGGQVVKFGGDALSLIWPGPPDNLAQAIWRAIQAALAMQNVMLKFATIPTSQGDFELRMKIGISAGEVLEVHAGGVYDRWEYVLAGAPMANMSSAENLAEAGEIVIDEAAWQLIGGRKPDELDQVATAFELQSLADGECYAYGEEAAPGFYRIVYFWSKLSPQSLTPPDWSQLNSAGDKVAATLRSYIPGAISSVLESGRSDMLAELKPMTVCFIGFSGIDYNNDPDAGSRLNNLLRDAQEAIYYYEGSVNKLAIGDKGSVLLVLFGAPPFFHEDDEVRGVACALALGKVAARYGLKLRIGLAAGPLFAGPLGAHQLREYTVIGDTVNLAARLMQKAEPGQVWVDRSVQAQSTRFFEYKDLGEIQIKGKIESRRVYQALREKEQDQEEMMGFLLSNQELTGRDNELALVDALADKVWAGQGQVLRLSGEAGVGKSRLAIEILRRWRERGGTSHAGDCVSYGQQTPYLPWRGVLASIAGLSPRLSVEERLARLTRILHRLPNQVPARTAAVTSMIQSDEQPGSDLISTEDYWVERLPLLAEILGLEAKKNALTRTLSDDLRRDNVFATIRAIALNEAHQRPTLILLEDTHWSDELSLELAVNLATEIGNQPLFLVLAHRPMGEPMPLPYQRLDGLPYTSQVKVTELDPAASLKLVQNKLGVKTLPPELADMIRSKGQGNPLFIEELVNSLLSSDELKVEDGQCFVVGDLDQLEMPDTVQKVVLARIDRLPEPEKITLKVAAAIGRSFQRDLLEAVHPWLTTETALNDHLTHLQAEDFTRQDIKENDLDFLFKHAITQEVAYETMLYSQRRQLHATIGAVLETRYGDNTGEIVDLLAYHYVRSDERGKALHYLQLAGQKALDGYANDAAISYFNEALAVAAELEIVKVQYDILAGRERAYDRVGNRVAQAQDLAQMTKLALDQHDLEQQLETGNRRLSLAANLGQYHEAIDIATETLTLARSGQQAIWEARTLTNLGITCWRQGDYDQARQAMQQALHLVTLDDTINDNQLQATCLNYLGLIHTRISDYEKAAESYQQALSIYRAISDRGGEAGCANNLGLLETSLGRYEVARQYYTQALSICHAIGDRQREGISLNTLGQVHTILGHYPLAKEQLERSLNIRRTIGDRRGEAFCLHDLGHLHLANDESSEAVRLFHEACVVRRELGETGNYIASLAARGEAGLASGDLILAYQCLKEAIDHMKNETGSGEYPPQNVWWIYARVCRARGQEDEAQRALMKACDLVNAKAGHIHNFDFRRNYLENVKINAAIMAEVNAFQSISNE